MSDAQAIELRKEAMGEGWGRLFGDGAGGGAEPPSLSTSPQKPPR